MNKDFWYYIRNHFICHILSRHMRNVDNYIILIGDDSEEFLYLFPNSLGIYMHVPRDEKSQTEFKNTYKLQHITHPIYGAIFFDMSIIRQMELKEPNIDNTYPYSLMNRIKRLILHECRHQQQHDYLMELFKNDFDVVQSIYDNEAIKGDNDDEFEVDAELYAISYITNERDIRYTLNEFVAHLIDLYPDIFKKYGISYRKRKKRM